MGLRTGIDVEKVKRSFTVDGNENRAAAVENSLVAS